MTVPRIRRVEGADARALATLDATSFDVGWDEDSVRALLVGGGARGWCRDLDGEIVAAVIVRVVAGEGELLRLAVAPTTRRRGHARALMAEVQSMLGPDVPHGLHLEVRASNAAARALYASLGWVETGRRRAYYSAPIEDAILMRWVPGSTHL